MARKARSLELDLPLTFVILGNLPLQPRASVIAALDEAVGSRFSPTAWAPSALCVGLYGWDGVADCADAPVQRVALVSANAAN